MVTHRQRVAGSFGMNQLFRCGMVASTTNEMNRLGIGFVNITICATALQEISVRI